MGQNSDQAVKWNRAAAEQGFAQAQYDLGVCYANGDGVEQDAVESVKWFRKAAEQGHPYAQYALGVCSTSSGLVMKEDSVQAAKRYEKAMPQREIDTLLYLGVMFYKGEIVKKDLVQAARHFRNAAKQGDTQSMFMLGICYFSGSGVKQDNTQAQKWFRKAVEQLSAGTKTIMDEWQDEVKARKKIDNTIC